MSRAAQGDEDAFACLVEHHWSRVVRLARSVLGEADAEDAAQEGLLRAWRKLPGLRAPEAFDRWLSRVVVRVCLKRARRRRATFVSLERIPEPRAASGQEPEIDVGRLLASLAPRQRVVMHMTVVDGMTDSEIAPILGISASSVRAHRHRAIQRIRDRVSEGGVHERRSD